MSEPSPPLVSLKAAIDLLVAAAEAHGYDGVVVGMRKADADDSTGVASTIFTHGSMAVLRSRVVRAMKEH